jgi:hypothetical protein
MGFRSLKITTAAIVFGAVLLMVSVGSANPASAEFSDTVKTRIDNSYRGLPISFEINQGQTAQEAKFLSRGKDSTLFLTATGAVLALSRFQHDVAKSAEAEANPPFSNTSIAAALTISFVGANGAPVMVGLEAFPGKVNYIKGSDPKLWRTNIPTYAKVKYESVYPGVDVVYYGNQQRLEYDFIVAPGGDPQQIRLSYAGAETLEIDAQGDLVARVDGREIRQHRPVVYQDLDGVRKEIPSSYVLHEQGQVTIDVSSYDNNRNLVIDPVLTYSTYLGGIGTDQAFGIAVDATGDAYVVGTTDSTNFPTLNPLQPLKNGLRDGFVFKLNAAGSNLIYSTYLGGSSNEELLALAIDSSGSAYVTGGTTSGNFPVVNPVQAFLNGGSDAIIAKLNPNGSGLVYSTYLGGSGFEIASGIAVDSLNHVHIAGWTGSVDFPIANAIQPTFGGGGNDGFVTKLNSQGTGLIYSSYLGGSESDLALDIAVDSSANTYVVGRTFSTDFPTANAIQSTSSSGSTHAFVTKLNAQGSDFVYSTYLGGRHGEARAVATNAAGNAYVTGSATSVFPLVNPLQASYGGNSTAFITKFNSNGSVLDFSTYFGGNGPDSGVDLAVDANGNVYVTGITVSPNFPTAAPLQSTCSPNPTAPSFCSADAFVAKICVGRAPTIEAISASPEMLSPPNHQMVPVSVSVSISNECNAPATCRIISVNSNEPVEGTGDGDTSPDWIITGDLTVDLRAERSGQGDGRKYSVTIACTTTTGDSSTKNVSVTVPRK